LATTPFTVQRRIAWGDCDPARIYYTPRAVDYAVEAVEAWFEAALGISWVELAEQYDLEATFVHVACDYLRALVASQMVDLQVWVTRVEHSSVNFTVVGEVSGGVPGFIARLEACFVERKQAATVRLPATFRQRIETYRDQCGSPTSIPKSGNRSELMPGHEAEVSITDDAGYSCLSAGTVPFARQQRVRYGDCTASGHVYPPRVFDYAVEAVGEWYEALLGLSWMDLVWKRQQGAPFVAVRCEFLQSMVPGQTMTVAVWVTRLGGASVEFAVVGCDAKGTPCFDARLAACFIDQNGFKTMRIPEEFRTRIQAYQADCEVLKGAGRIRHE